MTALAARTSNGLTAFLGRGGAWFVVLALALVGYLAVPEFSTEGNLQNLMRQSAALGIVSIGQTIVVLAGGIDLSVGALMGLVAVIANGQMRGRAEAIPEAVFLTLTIGLVVGLFNGTMVVRTKINPLILTFGMLSVLQGVIFLYTDRTFGSSPPEFTKLEYGLAFGIPISALLYLVILGFAWFGLRFTTFGRYIYAVGGNIEYARRAGVPTRAVQLGAYTIAGFLASVAGLVLAARLGTGYTLAGVGFDIDSVIAVVLGGTLLTGGHGGLIGTLAGLLILSLVNNVLNLLAVSAYIQQIIGGVIVITAVALAGIAQSARRAR